MRLPRIVVALVGVACSEATPTNDPSDARPPSPSSDAGGDGEAGTGPIGWVCTAEMTTAPAASLTECETARADLGCGAARTATCDEGANAIFCKPCAETGGPPPKYQYAYELCGCRRLDE